LGSVWDFVFAGAVLATLGAALLAPRKPVPSSPTPGEIPPLSRSKYITLVLIVAAAVFLFAHVVAPRFS
jgi:hypothetical protein